MAVPEDAIVIAHTGRWHTDKDQPTLIRALGLVVKDNPHVILALAGRGMSMDGPAGAFVTELGLGAHVRLLGELNDIRDLLAAANIFCLSSTSEALPLSLLEAMAMDLVPVVTDVGACSLVVGEAGRVCPAGDEAELADGLRWALEAVAAGTATGARHEVEGRGLDTMLSKYRALQRSLTGGLGS